LTAEQVPRGARDEIRCGPLSPNAARGTIIASPIPRGRRPGRPVVTNLSRLHLRTPFGAA
jgi:hypothetical protein